MEFMFLIALVVFVGGFLKCLMGFGMSMVLTPFFILYYPPDVAVPIIVIMNLVSNIIMTLKNRKKISLSHVSNLFIPGLVGVGVGTYLLSSLDIVLLKPLIFSIICIFAVLLFRGAKIHIRDNMVSRTFASFLSGLSGGLTDINGPPMALFLATQHLQKQKFRDNLITFFLFLEAVTLIFLGFFGLVTAEVIMTVLYFLPALLFGLLVGEYLFKRLCEKSFHRIMLAIILIVSLSNLVYSLSEYL